MEVVKIDLSKSEGSDPFLLEKDDYNQSSFSKKTNLFAAYDAPNADHSWAPDSSFDSDERLKEAIFALKEEGCLNKLLNLKGVRFKYKEQLNLPKEPQLGFIAQEVREIIPVLVKKEGEYLKLNYQGLIPILVEAIKELNEKVIKLEKKLKS